MVQVTSAFTQYIHVRGMPALGTAPSAVLAGAKGSWEHWDLRPLRPGEHDPSWGPNMGLHVQPCPGETILPCTGTLPVLTPADTCTARVNVINQLASCQAEMYRVMLPAAP